MAHGVGAWRTRLRGFEQLGLRSSWLLKDECGLWQSEKNAVTVRKGWAFVQSGGGLEGGDFKGGLSISVFTIRRNPNALNERCLAS
jgi:hypothetical protein